MKKVKKILITSLALLLLLFMNLSLMAGEKSKKPSLGFYLSNYHFSTSFEPGSMNLSVNNGSAYDNGVFYLIDFMLIRGSGWDYLEARMCINDKEPIARGRVLSKSFEYKPGDVFPLTVDRSFALSKSGMPFQVGASIPFSKAWSVSVNTLKARTIAWSSLKPMTMSQSRAWKGFLNPTVNTVVGRCIS